MQIIICDRNKEDLQQLRRLIEWVCWQHYVEAEVLCVTDYLACEALLEKKRPAGLILAASAEGMAWLHHLRSTNHDCPVVIVAQSGEYAIEAFALHICHYIVYPFSTENISEALQRLSPEFCPSKYFLFSRSGRIRKVMYDAIVCGQVRDERIYLHLSDGRRVWLPRNENDWEELFFAHRIVYCHPQYLVNAEAISSLRHEGLRLRTGMTLPVSEEGYEWIYNYLCDGEICRSVAN